MIRSELILKLIIPNRNKYSSLLRKFGADIVYMNDLKHRLQYKKEGH